MIKVNVSHSLILAMFICLSGCASFTQLTAEADPVVNQNADPEQVAVEPQIISEPLVDPDLPDVDLDAKTLESLLTQYFASYQGDWGLASNSALEAAMATRDYRVARTATLLALRNNDYATALGGAQLWLELRPNETDALNINLISHVGVGKIEQAIEIFDAHRGDKTIDAHIRYIAGLIVRQQNAEGAIDLMRHYAQTNAESAQVLLSGAYVSEVFENYDQAQQWLDQAINLRPDWDLAAQMKAEILGNRGKTEERDAFVEQYAKSHPQSVGMNINYSAVLARQERFQEAFELMQTVLEKNPTDTAALNYIGALAQQLDKADLAGEYYQRALEQDPHNDDARWSLGRLALIDEKYAAAERLFNEIKAEESFIRAQIQVANARYHTKGLDSALGTLELLEPVTQDDYINVTLARHRLLLNDHKYEEAFASVNETLLYLPTNLDLLYARALVAAELKKVDVAEVDFRAIIAQEPDNVDALNALGYTLADQTQRYDEAKVLIEKALEIRPEASHIQDSMGWVLYRLKDYENAITFLKKAYAAYQEVEIGAHLGEVYWEVGDQEKAKTIWQESFEKDAQSPVLNDTLKRYGVTFGLEQTNTTK